MVGVDFASGWPRRDLLSSEDFLGGGDISIASIGDPRSLMGLTSSGRGRGGDVGEWGMLGRGVLFQGVEEPCVSIDRRG